MLIKRIAKTIEGTFGVLEIKGFPFCLTLEDPWAGNERGISCIPSGTYSAMRRNSPKFGQVWEILNVPGRSGIFIHWGNTAEDTTGCILVGKSFGLLSDKHAIMQSKQAFEELMSETAAYDTYSLTIRD